MQGCLDIAMHANQSIHHEERAPNDLWCCLSAPPGSHRMQDKSWPVSISRSADQVLSCQGCEVKAFRLQPCFQRVLCFPCRKAAKPKRSRQVPCRLQLWGRKHPFRTADPDDCNRFMPGVVASISHRDTATYRSPKSALTMSFDSGRRDLISQRCWAERKSKTCCRHARMAFRIPALLGPDSGVPKLGPGRISKCQPQWP